MINYEEDYEFASQRINETVVRLANGTPVYVNAVLIGDKMVAVSHLAGKRELIHVKLKDLDLSSPPLGFCNTNGAAVFVMRIPRRRDWRQGLRAGNCKAVVMEGNNKFFDEIPFDNLIGPELANCIVGKYPSLDTVVTALAKASNKVKSLALAWDRHWAANSKMEVFYKDWGVVGELSRNDGALMLENGFGFLRESFEESIQ